MKLLPISLALLSGVVLGYGLQDKKEHQDKKPAAAAGQDGGMPMPKPGPEHAMLQKAVGEWDAVMISEGQKTKGTMTTRSMSGFFTVDDFKGEFMGGPFTGHGVNGYCPVKKQFFAFWVDSMGASPAMLTGNYDAAKKEMTLSGDMIGMDGKPTKMTTVTRYKDDDHFEFSLVGPGPDGKDGEMLKIEYTRKKK